MSSSTFEPKLITVLKDGYSFKQFYQDLSAGVIVGIVALPLAIAFAIASGVKPEQGLYTAIVAGLLISIFSGSRVQIGGPTGAFIVIVYGIVQQYGYDGLATATLLAGVLLLIMGFARLGTIIQFIPYPVTIGFTSGIALIIFFTQVRDFLGLQITSVPSDFIGKLGVYVFNIRTFNPYSILIGIISLVLIVYSSRLFKRLPGSLIAILVTTAIVHIFKMPVETIGSSFGSVPNHLPQPHFPAISWDLTKKMFSPAISIAFLAGIESLLSAVVADGMTGRRHRSNMELIAQGIANIISPIFGGIPATGAIARTATNIKNGGRTPFAGIIHALTLLLIMMLFGKWAALIPMASLSAILMIVAYNMSEWHLFIKLFKSTKSDILVLLSTFLLTVLVDLTVAIQVGIVLASFLFMKRMAEVTQAKYITALLDEEEDRNDLNSMTRRIIPTGVEIFEINGPFFFGAAEKFKTALHQINIRPKILILRLRKVLSMDATGLRALEDVYQQAHKDGTILILSGVHAQPLIVMQRAGFLDIIGENNIFGNIDDSLDRARDILGLAPVQHPVPFVPTVNREADQDKTDQNNSLH